jgi:hypothetical protein
MKYSKYGMLHINILIMNLIFPTKLLKIQNNPCSHKIFVLKHYQNKIKIKKLNDHIIVEEKIK